MSNSKLPLHAQYWGYVERYIPAANRPLLSKELDDGDDTEAHKIEIAKYLIDWEVQLQAPLGLTREEVHAIKEGSEDSELKRRKLLSIWKNNRALDATYGLLLNCCLHGRNTRAAQKICEILARSPAPSQDQAASPHYSQREEVVAACTQVTSVRKAAASSPWDAEVTSTFLQIIKYRDRNTGQCKQIKIITELAPIWKKVGSMLGFSNNNILTFESPGSGRPFVNCLMNVFGQWLNNSVNMRNRSSYPATWRGVCNLLQDCDYGGPAEMLRDAVEADFSNIRGNFNECTPSLTSTHTNGATPEEHLNHPHPLSNGNSHVSNSHSPIPQATHVASNGGTPSGDATHRASGDTPHIASGDATQRASGDTPHIASGDATQRAKMTAEEVAEWLAMEGIEKEDVKIIKGHKVNERLFLKLDPHSPKLEHVSQTTKELLKDLQKDMQNR